ncbi:MAG: nuclear transport factor 2 family protein [Acidimicrobiia bacterium]
MLRRRTRHRHDHRAPPLSAEQDAAVVRQLIDLVGGFEIDAALGLVTDDVILEFPFRGDGGPRRLEGDEAKDFIRALPKLFSQMPFHDVVVHGRLPSGDVVAEYRSEGVTRSGRAYPNSYVGFFEVRDGRVRRWREYFDPNVVAAAFPARPTP